MKLQSRRIYWIGLVIILFVGIFGWLALSRRGPAGPSIAGENSESSYYQTGNADQVGKIASLNQHFESTTDTYVFGGTTSHHLPTAMPLISDFYNYLRKTEGPREIFVVVGPDHFERCQSRLTITDRAYQTPYGVLPVAEDLVRKLEERWVAVEPECFIGEHSIGVQAIFIKQYFPDAKILPIIVSSSASLDVTNAIADFLSGYADRVVMVGSVDFSHYQTYQVARNYDEQSKQMLLEQDVSAIQLVNTDSPPSLRLLVEFVKKAGASRTEILEQKNSYDYTGVEDNTTGYIDSVFIK